VHGGVRTAIAALVDYSSACCNGNSSLYKNEGTSPWNFAAAARRKRHQRSTDGRLQFIILSVQLYVQRGERDSAIQR